MSKEDVSLAVHYLDDALVCLEAAGRDPSQIGVARYKIEEAQGALDKALAEAEDKEEGVSRCPRCGALKREGEMRICCM